MNTNCALCGIPLTSMDTVLGENKLSDGGILCNKCLNKATNINKDLVYDLGNYSLVQVRDIVLGESIEKEEEITLEPVVESSVSRTVVTFSHSFQVNVGKKEPEKPTRLDEIKDQIIALNTQISIFANVEVNELANVLDRDERLIAITEGKYLNNNLDGILISTERRVIFIDRNFFSNTVENDFPHHKIVSVQHSYGLVSSELKLYTNEGIKAEFKLNNRNAAKIFYEAIQNYIHSPQNPLRQQHQKSIREEDAEAVFEKLEKLGKLREKGILTNEEFEMQKKKLLDKL
ncbi:PH domain-containing protein [Chryseobacterium sp. SIMBA_028]|uniref:PH domain-containing protein n=1 Tax=Chryseobacterium sp. SIMBA_028 TaxID=3085771 RepID=UPI00397C7241